LHIFALAFTKSSWQISWCELLYCLFYSLCGFFKHDLRRISKPFSVGTWVCKITVTRKQVYIHWSACPVRIKLEGPPFKTTTLHQSFNYGQQAPGGVRTKASASRARSKSRQKGEQSWSMVLHRKKIPAIQSEIIRTNNAMRNREKDDEGKI